MITLLLLNEALSGEDYVPQKIYHMKSLWVFSRQWNGAPVITVHCSFISGSVAFFINYFCICIKNWPQWCETEMEIIWKALLVLCMLFRPTTTIRVVAEQRLIRNDRRGEKCNGALLNVIFKNVRTFRNLWR